MLNTIARRMVDGIGDGRRDAPNSANIELKRKRRPLQGAASTRVDITRLVVGDGALDVDTDVQLFTVLSCRAAPHTVLVLRQNRHLGISEAQEVGASLLLGEECASSRAGFRRAGWCLCGRLGECRKRQGAASAAAMESTRIMSTPIQIFFAPRRAFK